VPFGLKAWCVIKTENFESFLDVWNKLPRSAHAFLPSKDECNPGNLGSLLSQTALFRYDAKYQLTILFVGSEMERLSGLGSTGENYYSLISDDLKLSMNFHHKTIFNTPCGAYVGDVITPRNGNSYLFETMQFPVCDSNGEVKFLLAYGYGRRDTGNLGERDVSDRTGQHIRDLHYMDLGAGAPDNCIIDFEMHP